MTFLCTRNAQLVPGGQPPWPGQWAFRCDGCGRVLPYGVVLDELERRISRDQARFLGYDQHRCGDCEGWIEQLGLGLFT